MVQRLALPLMVAPGGHLASLEQDSPEEIAQSVALVIATRPGERRSVADYGMEDPVFGGLDIADMVAVVAEWEPRADPAQAEMLLDQIVEQNAGVYPAELTTEEGA
jgi:phage baseplate assembly protein W